ncbi:tRNA (cytosine(34)-C(5))-methyltransferase [Contarinia nasturtii]|uniref:tRNA (cytosine(34)-C(5))-methyltransferase n=1 Tax=Contarinia nasturtii TaxID=265458 RepID=UPI0012D42C53|nr:tRNA (cytosine(34)-C(5))-methyltransferase [Contarinia nasturtii]
MGRGYKRNRFAQKRRDKKQGKENVVRADKPYENLVKESETFDRYYKHVKICPENEWDDFIKTLQSDLPVTFRISASRNTAKKLLDLIENDFFTKYISDSTHEQKSPIVLEWYPGKMAYQLELSRKDIRRTESHYKLHNFLIAETTAGSISRQEAVSMIPPIVLDVKPHHKVLDMCAAPGSKTAQLIEALHADENNPIPSGFVIANDVDNNRCYMLVHQAKRLNSPCFVVINQDSACMPAFETSEGTALKFDRILCDVPCSGDGTLRKNPDIWKRWHLGHGLNLHGIQYRIARRGAELLEIGGRLVYSTCSLNPVENEAVLHRLLKDSEGALELVDSSDLLPGLKYAPGISYWELSSKECKEFYRTFDEVPKEFHTVVRPQMFPPSAEEAPKYCLEKCIRLLPHFQNTGAFFVAALTKTRPLPWERKSKEAMISPDEEATVSTAETAETVDASNGVEEKRVPWGPQRKKRRIYGYKEDPFVFFTEDEPVWREIKSYFDIDIAKLTAFSPAQLLTRSVNGKKKNIYFCSKSVKDLVQANEEHIKIINTGVKVFARCDARNINCDFRLANEGLEAIGNVIGNARRIEVSKEDLILLLEHNNPQNPPQLDTMSDQTKERMKDVEAGSCLLVYKDNEFGFTLNVVGWKGGKSLRAYIDLNDSIHMLRLLGADVTKFEVNKFQKKETEDKTTQKEDENDAPPMEMETNQD